MNAFDEIPDVTMTLVDGVDRHPLLEDALHDPEVTRAWNEAEPETRAAILLSLAWGSREHGIYPGYLPDGADDYGYRTAEDFHQYARDFAGSSEEFHGVRFPMMPLPGQAGALASSLGFDREEDGLDVSLRTALLLLAPARKKETPRNVNTEEKPPGVNVLEAAYTRWRDMPHVSLKMHRQDLYLIVMALQTTTRFPGTTPSMAKHMETIGRQIQEAIVDDPELYSMTESGWNPEHDVDPDETQTSK